MFNTVRHKYGAKSCEYDGKKFRSKLERSAYILLKEEERKGNIIFFLREVPFELSNRTSKKHRVDFMIFWSNGSVNLLETKGLDLEAGKLRRRLVEDEYSVNISVAKNQKEILSFISDSSQKK